MGVNVFEAVEVHAESGLAVRALRVYTFRIASVTKRWVVEVFMVFLRGRSGFCVLGFQP